MYIFFIVILVHLMVIGSILLWLDYKTIKNLGTEIIDIKINKYHIFGFKLYRESSLTESMEQLFSNSIESFESTYIPRLKQYDGKYNEFFKDVNIIFRDEINLPQHNLVKASATSINLFKRFLKPTYLINISVFTINIKKFNSPTVASLIMHELVHHYLEYTTGCPWGGIKVNGLGTHEHSIWKEIGV